MECLIGLKGKDFVLMATDCVAGRSIIAMKNGVLLFYSILLVTHHTILSVTLSYHIVSYRIVSDRVEYVGFRLYIILGQ